MRLEGYSALLVYGNTRLHGSLRYLSDYFPDRSGWTALGPDRKDVHIFEGATLVVPLEAEPVLVMDFGLVMDQEPHVDRVPTAGLVVSDGSASIAATIANVLLEANSNGRVGIETWEKFPAPLYAELSEAFPRTQFEPSTVVEELRLVKTAAEIALMRKAAEVADLGNQAFLDALSSGLGRSELELIRTAEAAMRIVDPVYEDACASGPSKIQSGSSFGKFLLHEPQSSKVVSPGDVVNWDICMRYCGYSIDTSGTRVMGKALNTVRQAHEVQVLMVEEVIKLAKPGTRTPALVDVARQVARDGGFELWADFIGHGIGLDLHERPDMGLEDLALVPGMTITVEPRIALENALIGTEDVVLITENEAECLTRFPKTPFELSV